MDSSNNENLYDSNVHNDSTKVSLIDTGIQLDLVDNSKPEVELIQTFPNNFVDIDMKMPITIQNCLPLNLQVSSELVVIANNGDSSFMGEPKIPLTPIQAIDGNENLHKRFCIEQDGQTYILSLQDPDVLTKIVDVRNKSIPNGIQFVNAPKDYSLASKQGINQNWFTSRAEKNTLHNEGHVWKQGMWGKEEIELLESNIKVYCEEHDITNPATIIFKMAKDERKDFYRTVAKGLNRPLFSVYRRVIRMYDNKNHVGKYTSEELEKLKKLRCLYGNNWQAIGAAMGRSASSIKDRCRLMKDNCNQGKWLPAEERRLAEAVYEFADAYPGEKISSGLPWAIVAEKVGTRSEKQCRTKWLNYLNWKEVGGTEWTRQDDIVLICSVCNMNALDENHLDWTELAKGWSSVRSPQWLRGKWWNLKRHVPNTNTTSFREVCDYLYKTFVLKIQVKNEQDEEIDNDLTVQSPPVVTQSKPTILHAISGPAPPPAGIVVSTVPQTLTCTAPVISLPEVNTIGVETAHFSPITTESMLQTVEMIPQNVQLAPNHHAFLTAPHPAQTVPLATALASNQIIIHTVTADGMPSDGNIVHINAPSEIIIGPSSPVTLTSLASTQIPSAPSSPSGIHDHSLEDSSSVLMEDATFETEVIEEQGIQVSELDDDDDDESENICQDNRTAHIILADPMLAAGHSPEIVALDVENEKVTESMNTSQPKT